MRSDLIELQNILTRKGFIVKIFDNILEVKKELLTEIHVEESVGIGGSMTIQEMGIYEELKERGNKVYWHWKSENKKDEIRMARNSDTYLSSTNALTMDGKLVNMDGNGNRVSSMFFGHKNVYIVVGKNKICNDYDAAIERIRNVASPRNAERLNLSTPCRYTGRCNDCNSPERMCKAEVVIHRNPGMTNINIYLVDEELGY